MTKKKKYVSNNNFKFCHILCDCQFLFYFWFMRIHEMKNTILYIKSLFFARSYQIKKNIYIPFFSIWYLWLGVFISSPFLSTNQSLHLFFTLLKNSQQQITNDQSCTLKPACTIHIFRRILSLIQLKVWCTYRLNELLSVIRKCKELWV